MTEKLIIKSLRDFQVREGAVLFTSPALTADKAVIQQFCRSVNQMDWFHFDEERCAASPFGAIVAPGMFTLSLIHSVYFDNVELRQGELESVPIEDAHVEAATLILVLHHLPEPAKVLAEVRRVLEPG